MIKFVILVLVGGTVDITAHEILESGNFKEVLPASGGDWGGTCVSFVDKFSLAVLKILNF